MKYKKALLVGFLFSIHFLCFSSEQSPIFYRFHIFRYADWENRNGLIEVVQTCYIKCNAAKNHNLNLKKLMRDLPINVGQIIEEKITLEKNHFEYRLAVKNFQEEQIKLEQYEKQLKEHIKNPLFKKKPTHLLEWDKFISQPLLDYTMAENNNGKVYIETNVNAQNSILTTLSIMQSKIETKSAYGSIICHRRKNTTRTLTNNIISIKEWTNVKRAKIYFKQVTDPIEQLD